MPLRCQCCCCLCSVSSFRCKVFYLSLVAHNYHEAFIFPQGVESQLASVIGLRVWFLWNLSYSVCLFVFIHFAFISFAGIFYGTLSIWTHDRIFSINSLLSAAPKQFFSYLLIKIHRTFYGFSQYSIKFFSNGLFSVISVPSITFSAFDFRYFFLVSPSTRFVVVELVFFGTNSVSLSVFEANAVAMSVLSVLSFRELISLWSL